ncbi:MAG: hypothetical protein AMS26_07060 [Bacteroides sp. SM23_62]|nr:MAG: hypothetical protein AMS26_07060 [Bacteroides sp. SM23_62]
MAPSSNMVIDQKSWPRSFVAAKFLLNKNLKVFHEHQETNIKRQGSSGITEFGEEVRTMWCNQEFGPD